ncbi:Dihydrolipoyl dehydrogenase [Actinidia chinensis var. chinensis]|uniref:Dihydrolipoyl dehydrogenase n=1 Tax=Actinidia chinensis var. chinensis TaxID=1590841 RepID=A0A2R6PVQ2_ACTCC|nr:Dihydrolipoyl dehydrogenase [Actinidia chinensis var. chinensis]
MGMGMECGFGYGYEEVYPTDCHPIVLLHSSHMYHEAMHSFANHGVKFPSVEVDLPAMMAQKNKAVANLTRGIEVATGSDVKSLPGITIDEQRIVSSTGALALSEIPKKLVVIGAGYIGLEMGSVWGRLGTEVTVVEFAPDIVPTMDSELTRFATNVSGVYAIGDVIPGPTLDNKAEDDGVACLEFIAGKEEEQVKALGFDYRVGKFPFLANSSAKAFDDAEGVVKILAYKETDKILRGLYHGTECWGAHSRGSAGFAVWCLELHARIMHIQL